MSGIGKGVLEELGGGGAGIAAEGTWFGDKLVEQTKEMAGLWKDIESGFESAREFAMNLKHVQDVIEKGKLDDAKIKELEKVADMAEKSLSSMYDGNSKAAMAAIKLQPKLKSFDASMIHTRVVMRELIDKCRRIAQMGKSYQSQGKL